MAAVHPQPSQDSLPPGWECRYDPRTGRYYFLNHIEHITTWEDPRLRHNENQQSYTPYYGSSNNPAVTSSPPPHPPNQVSNSASGRISSSAHVFLQGGYSPHYGSPKTPFRFKQEGVVQVDERILMKLCVQFPTVEEGHIWQLLKQYHNRENVAVSALLAEGQPRAQTHSIDLTPKLQRPEVQMHQVDEAMYFKLRNFFPTADPDHIRNLQKMFNNQEHEIIYALVAGKCGSRHQSPHPSSPKMKLRYLKLVFPEADEAILFDVLNNCDNNAQEASTRLCGMGYAKRDTPIARPYTSHQYQKKAPESPLPTLPPERPIIVIPPNASDKIILIKKIQEQFPAVSRTLVNMALDSSSYNEDRAKQFLAAMTPQDGTRPSIPLLDVSESHDVASTSDSSSAVAMALPADVPPVPPPRSRHSSTSQDSDAVSRHSSLERHSLRGDSSREATPSKSPSIRGSPARSTSSPVHKVSTTAVTERLPFRQKFKRDVLNVLWKKMFKFCKSTSTQDENVSKYRTKPKGADANLRKGPSEKHLLKDYMPWMGSNSKHHKGPDPSLRRGPDPGNLSRKETRAKGPQRDIFRGTFSSINQHSTSNGNAG